MSVIRVPLEIQEERARKAGVSLAVWQAQSIRRVANMRAQAHRKAQSTRVIQVSELSDSQKRALHRMSLSFADE
ncbi:MAG: hypothetical protein RSB44_15220 [Carnobacterium sp.]|uniref:hypothetical protein n=1 Tax=Acinetobacter sp. TaxID=472 RepID=UPI002FC5F184